MRLLFHEPKKGGCLHPFSLLGCMYTTAQRECSETSRGFAAKQVCIQVLLTNPCYVTLSKFLHLSSLDCSEPLRGFNEIIWASTVPAPHSGRPRVGMILSPFTLSFAQHPFNGHGLCRTHLFTFHPPGLTSSSSKSLCRAQGCLDLEDSG